MSMTHWCIALQGDKHLSMNVMLHITGRNSSIMLHISVIGLQCLLILAPSSMKISWYNRVSILQRRPYIQTCRKWDAFAEDGWHRAVWLLYWWAYQIILRVLIWQPQFTFLISEKITKSHALRSCPLAAAMFKTTLLLKSDFLNFSKYTCYILKVDKFIVILVWNFRRIPGTRSY